MSEKFFQFDSYYFLALILLLPLIYRRIHQGKGLGHILFSSNELLTRVPPTTKEKWRFLVPLTRTLALLFLIIGLARPQLGNKTTEVLSEGIDIMLTLDTSGSMKAEDFKLDGREANRLDAIKSVIQEFVTKRPYDRMGMIVFGDEAFTQCPLTTDTKTLTSFLDWLKIGMAGDGTGIGNALALSVKRLKDQKTKSKIIILLTDGRNNAGEIAPMMAAQMATQNGIKVYSIGVGSNGPVPFPEQTPFGVRRVLAKLDLDEETLKAIAEETGGRYFRATETEQLAQIYSEIDKLEKSEIQIKEFKDYEEYYIYFVFSGLIFLLLEVVLSRFYFVRVP